MRTTAVAAAAVLLLTFARSGQSLLTIQVMFTLFVVAATIWIRSQYVDTLRDRIQWLIPWQAAAVVLLVAAALVLVYLQWHRSGALLCAVLLGYFVAGSFVTWLRHIVRGPVLGVVLTIAAAVLGAIGIWLLGVSFGAVGIVIDYLLLAVAFLVLLPVGLALLSERTIRRVCNSRGSGAMWGGIAGAVVFIVTAAVLTVLLHSGWLVVALVVMALLLIALVSRTQADIAMIIGAIALVGVTPLPADKPPALTPSGDSKPVLVALGDSYLSGEGAAIYYSGTDEGGGDQCRRSPTAWAAVAGQQRPFGRLEFLACSGARTDNIQSAAHPPTRPGAPVPQPQTGEGNTQLDAYLKDYGARPGFVPQMVVVSIGGNDAGFSTIGTMCVAPGNCDTKSALWTGSLDQVRQTLRDTYQQIDSTFPKTPVVIIPYPDPIKVGGVCHDAALAPSERRFLHEFVTGETSGLGLNTVLRQTAGEFGFYYPAEMQNALADAHLQLCDDANEGRPGLNFIGLRSVRGIAEQRFNPTHWLHGSLHPNERGHAALLQAFEAWLPDNVSAMPPRVAVTSQQARTRNAALNTAAAAPVPPCDLFDATPAGCRPQGMEWTKDQVRRAIFEQSWPCLIAMCGVWVAAVAFFGLRYRRELSRQA